MWKQVFKGFGWGTMFAIVVIMALMDMRATTEEFSEDVAEMLPNNHGKVTPDDELWIEEEPQDKDQSEDVWTVAGMEVAQVNPQYATWILIKC